MQVFQPLELAFGIFIGLVGLLSLLCGLYYLKNPAPPIRGRNVRIVLLNGLLLLIVAVGRISSSFDHFGHPSLHTLALDVVSILAVAVVVFLSITMGRADLKAQRQRRSKPLA